MTDDLEPLDERWKESAREYHDFRRKAGPRQRPNAAARSAPKRNGKPAAAARPSPKTVDFSDDDIFREETEAAQPSDREESSDREEAASTSLQPLPYIDMSDWDTTPAPEREWAVEGRIPMYQPHLTTGHGAIGKSIVELTRAVAHVLGKPWLGMQVRQGPVIYMGAEDEADELHRRLEAILRYYGATFSNVIGQLHLLSYAGEDCLLGVPDGKGIIRPTELFQRLLADAVRIAPVAVTIDTLSDVYAGDEINRNQTTQFVKLLQSMAIKARSSIAILAHPSNAGIATGSGISGSTGWHNKMRSRAYMRVPLTEKGDEIDSDVREIEFMKNNYGRQGDVVQVRWQDGLFVPENTADNDLKRRAQGRKVEMRFLELLGRYEEQGRTLSDNPNAPSNYAPRVFARETEGERYSANLYQDAMGRLFSGNEIHLCERGPPSRRVHYIVRGRRHS
jgi:RecA-family ATPase